MRRQYLVNGNYLGKGKTLPIYAVIKTFLHLYHSSVPSNKFIYYLNRKKGVMRREVIDLTTVDLDKLRKVSTFEEITLFQISGLYDALYSVITHGSSKRNRHLVIEQLFKQSVFERADRWADNLVCTIDHKNKKSVKRLTNDEIDSLHSYLAAVNIKYPSDGVYEKIQDYINDYHFDNGITDYAKAVNHALHALKRCSTNPLLPIAKEKDSVKTSIKTHYRLLSLPYGLVDLLVKILMWGVTIREKLCIEYGLIVVKDVAQGEIIKEKIDKFIAHYVRAQLIRLKITVIITNQNKLRNSRYDWVTEYLTR